MSKKCHFEPGGSVKPLCLEIAIKIGSNHCALVPGLKRFVMITVNRSFSPASLVDDVPTTVAEVKQTH